MMGHTTENDAVVTEHDPSRRAAMKGISSSAPFEVSLVFERIEGGTRVDVLEEIVGEIRDEFDRERPMVVRLGDGSARLDGPASADELAVLFGPLPELDLAEYDTVSGLVYHALRRVPEPGDTVTLDGVVLTVETLVRRRVGTVLATTHGSRTTSRTEPRPGGRASVLP
jgi:hypothetical protein